MHSWKDSSRIHFNSIVMAFLMASISRKQTPLMTSLPGQVSREDDTVWWHFSWPGTDGCSGHCELLHCPGEAAMHCPATTWTSSHTLNKASAAGSLYRHAGWLSDPVARTPCGQFLSHQRMRSAWAWFWTSTVLLSLASVTMDTSTEGSGTWALGHTWRPKTHHQWWLSAASLVQFGDAWECPNTPLCAAPSGHCPEALAPSLHRSSTHCHGWFPAHLLSFEQPHTICFTHSTLSAVLLIEGLPLLELSSTSSHPSLNHLCHSKTREHDIVSSLYTSCSIPSASNGVYPSWTKNFRLICCSVVMAWQVKFK